MRTDMEGRHRRDEHKLYKEVYYPIQYSAVQNYDILLVSSKSVIGAGIRFFSQSDGKSAFVNHCAQILERDGQLVCSEANYPRHALTPFWHYLKAQEEGHCKLTLIRLKPEAFILNHEDYKARAEIGCDEYHNSIQGDKYKILGLLPHLLWSLARNLTPFIRGTTKHIPLKQQKDLFHCSLIVDRGWAIGQMLTMKDWFPSTLGNVPSPQDIYDSPWTEFISGYRRELI